MAAATADRKTRHRHTGRSFLGDLKTNVKIYLGTLVAKDANGWVLPAADVAAQVVVGVAQETVDNTGGANGAKKVQILTGVFEFTNAGGAIVQASKHGPCYVNDDNSVTTAAVAAQDIKAGTVDDFDATNVWVRIAPE